MAYSFIQLKNAAGSGNSATSPSITVAAHHLIIVLVQVGNATQQTVSGVTDTIGNTYHKITGCHAFAGVFGGTALDVWYAWDSVAGTGTVTATWASGGGYSNIFVVEYSGILFLTDPFDAANKIEVGTTNVRNAFIDPVAFPTMAFCSYQDTGSGWTAQSPSTDRTSTLTIMDRECLTGGGSTPFGLNGTGGTTAAWMATLASFKEIVSSIATPSGVTAAFTKNNPSASGSSTALPAGVTSVFTKHNPSATGSGAALPSGVTAAFTKNNPSANGVAVAQPSGVTAVLIKNNPIATGSSIAFPNGVTAVFTHNSPIGHAFATPSGVTAEFAEHMPYLTFLDASGSPISHGTMVISLNADAMSSIGQMSSKNTVFPLDSNGIVNLGGIKLLSSLTNNFDSNNTPSYTITVYNALGEKVFGPSIPGNPVLPSPLQ